jgi:hypothetical protein
MEKTIIDNFATKLKPLYASMISKLEKPDDYWLFCTQWGKFFPSENKQGILFYGRTNNGWIESSYDVEEIFSKPYGDIYNMKDQMEWMQIYPRKPFVRLLKGLSQRYYASEDWNQHIAWSNVCKMVPSGREGLSINDLWDKLYFNFVDIMKVELDVLSPRVVILVTGVTAGDRWDSPLFEIDKYKDLKFEETIQWYEDFRGQVCSSSACEKDGTIFIMTDRPEFRPVTDQVESIVSLIKRFQ